MRPHIILYTIFLIFASEFVNLKNFSRGVLESFIHLC